jgi:hypothetical protein
VSSETLTSEWLERLFADPSLARELPGVFGFIAHDRRSSRLLAIGDRLGIQAMHLHEDAAGTWRVSTHLSWLLLAADHDGALNEQGFFAHMGFGYPISGDEGVYDGVRKLSPSSYLVLSNGYAQEGTYWYPPEPSTDPEPFYSEETVSDLQAAIGSALTDGRLFLGLTAGKDSLCLASVLPDAASTVTGTFGHFESADQVQANQIQAVLGSRHVRVPASPLEEFPRWAQHVSLQSGGLTTASYVDKAWFTAVHIPAGYAYVMGEGGECVRDFFGSGGRDPIETLTQDYMTPLPYLRSTLSPRFSSWLDDYPGNLLSYSKSIAGAADERAYALSFYRYQRMPGNFSLRHAVVGSLRARVSPFLDPRFVARSYGLATRWHEKANLHRRIIATARPELLPFFDRPVKTIATPQDWGARLVAGVGNAMYELLDSTLASSEDAFDADGVRALCRQTIVRPSRAMYHLFRILSLTLARHALRAEARSRLAGIRIARPIASELHPAESIY